MVRETGTDCLADDYRFQDELEPVLIEQVRAIRPILRAHAAEGEERGWLAPATLEALDGIDGIWRMPVPRRLGGLGLSGKAILRISAELAKGDPAAAWVVQIIGGSTWTASLASDELQDEIFGAGVPRLCAVFGPPGKAKPVPGGYRVSGRWPYASGFRHASWGQWAVLIEDGEGPPRPGNFCFIPTAELRLENTWSTVALQATGSDTAVAEDIFVPAHRMVLSSMPLGSNDNRPHRNGAPSDLWPITPFVGRTGIGQAIGIAEAMLEEVIAAAPTRPIAATTFARKADSQVIQRDIGEFATRIRTARLLAEQAAGEIDTAVLNRCPLTTEQRAASKAMGGFAMKLLEETSQGLMLIAGSSAFSRDSILSRFWRDLAMVARHVQNSPNLGFETYGRSLLGITPNVFPEPLI